METKLLSSTVDIMQQRVKGLHLSKSQNPQTFRLVPFCVNVVGNEGEGAIPFILQPLHSLEAGVGFTSTSVGLNYVRGKVRNNARPNLSMQIKEGDHMTTMGDIISKTANELGFSGNKARQLKFSFSQVTFTLQSARTN